MRLKWHVLVVKRAQTWWEDFFWCSWGLDPAYVKVVIEIPGDWGVVNGLT